MNLKTKLLNGGSVDPFSYNIASFPSFGSISGSAPGSVSTSGSFNTTSSAFPTSFPALSNSSEEDAFYAIDACLPPTFDAGPNVGELYFNMSSVGMDTFNDMGDILQNLFEEDLLDT